MMSYTDLAKKLQDKATEFGVHLGELNSLNNDVKERLDKVLKSIEHLAGKSPNTKVTCSVCYTRPQTHAIIPCGHGGMCVECATRAQQRNRCFTCRGRIEDIIRIYL